MGKIESLKPFNSGKRINNVEIVRMLANGSGNLGSIPGRIIPKTQKWYLMPLS